MNQTNLLLLSIGSAVGSGFSAFLAWLTKSNLVGLVSIVAGIVAIVAGIQAFRAHTLTIRERKMSIRQMNRHNKF